VTDGFFWAWKFRYRRSTDYKEYDFQGVKVIKVEHKF